MLAPLTLRTARTALLALLVVTTAGCSNDLSSPESSDSSGANSSSVSLSCPGTLKDPYFCITNAGASTPATWALPDALYGVWVDTGVDVCMFIGVPPATSNRNTYFRYKGGFGGGTTTAEAPFGALVSKTGQLQPSASTFYFWTGSSDAQIKLLTFDTGSGRFVGWGFAKTGSCPW